MPAPILYLSNASVVMRLATESASANREWNGHCTTAEVVPSAGEEDSVVTLDGVRHVRIGVSAYALHLVFGQDWSASGISTWLWNNAGLAAVVGVRATLDPIGPNFPQMEGTVILAEGTYGGEAESWAEGEVTLPFTTKPSLRTSLTALAELPEPTTEYRRAPTPTTVYTEPDTAAA